MRKTPPRVILLGLVSFFNDIASEMIYPVMPIFLTTVLGAPVYIVGIIEGLAEGLSSFLKTVFGIWSDKLQKRKPFVFSGYLSSALSKVIIAVSNSWPAFFIGRLGDRFGKGLRTGARDALLLESATPKNKGYIFGLHRSLDTAGAVTGPIIVLILLNIFRDNIRTILYLAVIPSFVSLSFFLFIKEARKKVKSTQNSFTFSLKNLSPRFKIFLLVLGVFYLGNSSDTFLILRTKDLSNSLSIAIAVYVVYNVVYAVFSVPAGVIADRIGAKKVFMIGVFIYALVYIGFALNRQISYIWFLFAVYGLYIAFTDGVSKALVGSYIDSKNAGSSYGVMQTVISISTLLASVIGGFLWTAIAPAATFIFGSLAAFLAFIIFILTDTFPSTKNHAAS